MGPRRFVGVMDRFVTRTAGAAPPNDWDSLQLQPSGPERTRRLAHALKYWRSKTKLEKLDWNKGFLKRAAVISQKWRQQNLKKLVYLAEKKSTKTIEELQLPDLWADPE